MLDATAASAMALLALARTAATLAASTSLRSPNPKASRASVT